MPSNMKLFVQTINCFCKKEIFVFVKQTQKRQYEDFTLSLESSINFCVGRIEGNFCDLKSKSKTGWLIEIEQELAAIRPT